ncbi:MAG: hypothetical protein GXO74_01095 [Calditrichaeota bacterium]|nr:hypothetical protein [Calditrichota bacterium]
MKKEELVETTEPISNTVEVAAPKSVAVSASQSPDGYSLEVRRKLEEIVEAAQLEITYPLSRYDRSDRLNLELVGVCPDEKARAIFEVDKFVGGGFAGQVYRVKLVEIDGSQTKSFDGLQVGELYAIKILVPPSGFALAFRNFIYWLGFQGSFAAQTQFAAARAGVLWQKLIRRGAKVNFGDELSVVDTYATFFDNNIGSYGEVNEWVEGRNWNFEIDEEIFKRKKWKKLDVLPTDGSVKSFEYLEKRKFMKQFVALLHEIGAPEFARQYEWWTMKSQPNALKRISAGRNGAGGITAIDFRAGLALLPFLPMSPGDVKLILSGLFHGRIVQFDRGDLKKLEEFIAAHADEFSDLMPAFEELKVREKEYRESQPDLTRQGLKLILKRSLRKSVKKGLVRGWLTREIIDREHADKLEKSGLKFLLFYLISIFPFLGRFIRRFWGNRRYRQHIKNIFFRKAYLRRTVKAKAAHALIDWYRDGRVTEGRAFRLTHRLFSFWLQKFFFSWLPPTWHRFLTDRTYAWSSFKYGVTYPLRFYRDAAFRETWLLQNVEAGYKQGMLTEEEAEHIRRNIKNPFIQKYLKSVAVHVATLPVTQVISVAAALYAMIAMGQTWQEGMMYAGAILAVFQATPISPGSIVRGSYVLYLMVKERDVKNYWVAAMISFWHYVGYLGFPIQMVAKFPALSRLMAGRWATNIVHIIPVFGERGALLEHWIFDLFFNVPISLRKIFKRKK